MSSRTGDVITGEWLLDEAAKKAMEAITRSDKVRVDPDKQGELAQKVGLGAIKYAFLHPAIGGNIEFDFDKSLSFEGEFGAVFAVHIRQDAERPIEERESRRV